MSHDPAAMFRHIIVGGRLQFFQPLLADIQGDIQVILGDVAQVIGIRKEVVPYS